MTNATNARPQRAGQPSARPWDHADLCAYLRRPEAQPDDVAAAMLIEGQHLRIRALEGALRTVQMAINEALTGFPRPITDYKDVVNAALRGQS